MSIKFNIILNTISSVFVILAWVCLHQRIIFEKKFPPADQLKITNGIIHHPTFGDYPAEVEYKKGMSIMPGQKARVKINLPDKSE